MTEHADRIAEIQQMLDADDPGTTRGDLQSAGWHLLGEIERLHSWQGLLSLLDEHWPEETFPTLTDDAARDIGPRLVAALRRCDELEERLSALLCDLTDGLLSKTNYTVRTMVQQVEATFDKHAEEDRKVIEAERDALRARLDAMTTEYGHRWGTGDITNHGTDREQAEQMVRRALACNHGPGVKFATTHALMARQVTGWAEVEEVSDAEQ